MKYTKSKWIKNEYLNPNGTLFGGTLLKWIDEEAAIHVIKKIGKSNIVTRFISEINFVNPARLGDVIEIGICVTNLGETSITTKCCVRDAKTKKNILTIDKIVFVCISKYGKKEKINLTN